MSITYYVVIPFVRTEDGELVAEEPREMQSKTQAEATALTLANSKAGVIAFSRTGDPDVGEFEPAVIIRRYGETPEDLD
jgi:hypothetical protein